VYIKPTFQEEKILWTIPVNPHVLQKYQITIYGMRQAFAPGI